MITDIENIEQRTLKILADGSTKPFRPILRALEASMALSTEQRQARLPAHTRTKVSEDLSTTLQRLIADGLVLNPNRTHYAISANGLAVVQGLEPSNDPDPRLVAQFHEAMLDTYSRVGREVGYWAGYYLRSVRRDGGLKTAKKLLKEEKGTSKGFQALVDAGRPDLSVEHSVLDTRFVSLFTKEELREARARLAQFPKDATRVAVPPEDVYPDTVSDRRKYTEGAIRQVVINAYERDPRARKACLKRFGHTCQVCMKTMEQMYGPRGKAVIHVHHKKPLAASRGDYEVDPTRDLVPVCPNCHAMLHTIDPPLSVEELRTEIGIIVD